MSEKNPNAAPSETGRGTTLDNLRNVAEKMPGGFFIYRADEKEELIYANDVMLDIFGCDTEEEFRALTGYTFRGIVHPDDYDTVENSIVVQVEENEKRLDHVEYRITRKDGQIRRVDDFGRLAHTEEDGDVYYVLIRDITEEAAAREENQRRARVIEGLSVGYSSIFLLNFDTGNMRPYRLGNEYYKKITEDLGEDAGHANFRAVFSEYAKRYVFPEDQAFFLRQTDEAHMLERLVSESEFSTTYRCVGSEGTPVYTEVHAVRVDRGDATNRAVMGFRDVTERIARVQREISEKMEMQLELEREKRANEVKSSFLFSVSHDIRTPMNAISGFTALARSHMDNPALLDKFLKNVEEANGNLLALIDNLLEMSSLSQNKFALDELPTDLSDEISAVLEAFRPKAEEKRVELLADIDIPSADVLLDAVRFRRVLGNLLDNAVKFTPDGGRVTLSARQVFSSGSGYSRFQFTVADTGIGMAPGFLRRVGEVFEREQTSTESGFLGTGLGLAITKKILDLMGGSIEVTSEKGKGSVFTVSIPLKQAEAAKKRILPDAEEPGGAKAEGAYRLLLAEDMGVNRVLAETMLREAGFEVDSVPDGCDAVDAVENRPDGHYDAILMDIQMPVMNGYEAAKRIRAMNREYTDRLPIIALSANARERDKRMSMESGMVAHVAKPFDIKVLTELINETIAAARKEKR